MLEKIHSKKGLQLFIGLLIGFCFGFLLQRGGVTRYDVIMRQLLLRDWTVVKIILTAILTGMVGIYLFRIPGLAQLHVYSGSFGSTVIGGFIFGVGFAILGYCPGTMAGAVGQGSLDALSAGVPGMVLGAAFYVEIYPALSSGILKAGEFGAKTLPGLFKLKPWPVIGIVSVVILTVLVVLKTTGY
jgi:hypothetical protein